MTQTAPTTTTTTAPARREFDGVICFGGEDWWYHNRGHYDMQMMRELSAHVPVLYVNSIGMRVPKLGEGGMFFKRVLRKLKSFRRGYVPVRENFSVVSPFSIPGKLGRALSKGTLVSQVKSGAKKMGITKPLVWINCPPGAEALDALDAKVDRILDELGGTAPNPAPGLTAYISMIQGETGTDRVALDSFSYEIDSPFQSSPGGGFTRTSLGGISIGMESVDSSFVPFLFTAISGQEVSAVVIDLCSAGLGMPSQNECLMTIELFGVQIVRGGGLGEGLGHSYELIANQVRTTYREINGQGQNVGTHVHGWDYENGVPF